MPTGLRIKLAVVGKVIGIAFGDTVSIAIGAHCEFVIARAIHCPFINSSLGNTEVIEIPVRVRLIASRVLEAVEAFVEGYVKTIFEIVYTFVTIEKELTTSAA